MSELAAAHEQAIRDALAELAEQSLECWTVVATWATDDAFQGLAGVMGTRGRGLHAFLMDALASETSDALRTLPTPDFASWGAPDAAHALATCWPLLQASATHPLLERFATLLMGGCIARATVLLGGKQLAGAAGFN